MIKYKISDGYNLSLVINYVNRYRILLHSILIFCDILFTNISPYTYTIYTSLSLISLFFSYLSLFSYISLCLISLFLSVLFLLSVSVSLSLTLFTSPGNLNEMKRQTHFKDFLHFCIFHQIPMAQLQYIGKLQINIGSRWVIQSTGSTASMPIQ